MIVFEPNELNLSSDFPFGRNDIGAWRAEMSIGCGVFTCSACGNSEYTGGPKKYCSECGALMVNYWDMKTKYEIALNKNSESKETKKEVSGYDF